VEHLETNSLDYDAQRLQDLGYKQEFKREINLFVQAGFSFSTMAVLPNWLVGFGPAISAGGPSSLFWGWIVVTPFVFCIATSMAEVISAYPLAGGIYSWCYVLSSKEWGPYMSWMAGYMYVTGLMAANMTLAWTAAQYIYGLAQLCSGFSTSSTGAYVGLYCAVLILGTVYNFLGMRASSWLNKFMGKLVP
ncbi:hypothetical protein BCR43DRAFT_440156, partial [Syncephalastrum racemosum]